MDCFNAQKKNPWIIEVAGESKFPAPEVSTQVPSHDYTCISVRNAASRCMMVDVNSSFPSINNSNSNKKRGDATKLGAAWLQSRRYSCRCVGEEQVFSSQSKHEPVVVVVFRRLR